jgi:hypothetical protein
MTTTLESEEEQKYYFNFVEMDNVEFLEGFRLRVG